MDGILKSIIINFKVYISIDNPSALSMESKSVQSNLTVKIDLNNKIKRVREVPNSFNALKSSVEVHLKDNEQFKGSN